MSYCSCHQPKDFDKMAFTICYCAIRDVGYVQTNLAMTATTLTSVNYEAGPRLVYQSSREMVSFDSFKERFLLKTLTMMAKKNPYVTRVDSSQPTLVSNAVKHDTFTSINYDAAARLA